MVVTFFGQLGINHKHHRPLLFLTWRQGVLIETKTLQLVEMRRCLAWRITGNGLRRHARGFGRFEIRTSPWSSHQDALAPNFVQA
jgi:hypothetical protein